MYGGYSERTQPTTMVPKPDPVPHEAFPINSLDNTVTYLLPHEYRLLTDALARLVTEQGTLSRHLGEAMDQSSETFHDNAPQEAIVAESTVLSKRAEPLNKALGNYRLVFNPDVNCDVVTLGSVVEVSMNRGAGFIIRIVGLSILYEGYGREDTQEQVMSYSAPLARLLLGRRKGEIVNGELRDRDVAVEIIDLRQEPMTEGSSSIDSTMD